MTVVLFFDFNTTFSAAGIDGILATGVDAFDGTAGVDVFLATGVVFNFFTTGVAMA